MITHIGKREEESTCTQGLYRLYLVCNELQGEAYLREVPCTVPSLRSRTSLVLVNVKTGLVITWHGAKCPQHIKQRAKEVVNNISKKYVYFTF